MLDETAIRKTIIPKAKSVFESSTSVQAQAISLGCLERLMENLDKNEIANHIMPILLNAKLGEPLVLMPVIRKFYYFMFHFTSIILLFNINTQLAMRQSPVVFFLLPLLPKN